MAQYIPYAIQMGTKLASDYIRQANQEDGQRTSYVGKARGGRKKYSLRKLINSQVAVQEQGLGIQNFTTNQFVHKNLVSEYNLNGGYVSIGKATVYSELPMHVYDLSHVIGKTADNSTNYALQATNQCSDVNSRAWIWTTLNKFSALNNTASSLAPRWYINYPRNQSMDTNDPEKVYMNSIDVKFTAYGTQKIPQTMDWMIIKITDPEKCPDYPISLSNSSTAGVDNTGLREFQYAWSKLIYPYTVNPMLRGSEPGPPIKPWFKIVARKKVNLGERTSIDTVPNAVGGLHVKVNEVHDHCWSMKNFDDIPTGADYYDVPPNVTDATQNDNWKSKPYYTSRYYLVVRALGTIDTTLNGTQENQDNLQVLAQYDDAEYGTNQPQDPAADNPLGATSNGLPKFITIGTGATEYNCSYDLMIRTKYTKIIAGNSAS